MSEKKKCQECVTNSNGTQNAGISRLAPLPPGQAREFVSTFKEPTVRYPVLYGGAWLKEQLDAKADDFLTAFVAAALSGHGRMCLFDQEWNQGQGSDAIQPPPAEDARGSKSDHQNDRQIAAHNCFDGVGAKRSGLESRGNFQFVSRENRHADLSHQPDENSPHAFVSIRYAVRDENSIGRIKHDVSN